MFTHRKHRPFPWRSRDFDATLGHLWARYLAIALVASRMNHARRVNIFLSPQRSLAASPGQHGPRSALQSRHRRAVFSLQLSSSAARGVGAASGPARGGSRPAAAGLVGRISGLLLLLHLGALRRRLLRQFLQHPPHLGSATPRVTSPGVQSAVIRVSVTKCQLGPSMDYQIFMNKKT